MSENTGQPDIAEEFEKMMLAQQYYSTVAALRGLIQHAEETSLVRGGSLSGPAPDRS